MVYSLFLIENRKNQTKLIPPVCNSNMIQVNNTHHILCNEDTGVHSTEEEIGQVQTGPWLTWFIWRNQFMNIT